MNASETAADVRGRIRRGEVRGPTAGLAPHFVQTNLVVVPRNWADEFALLTKRNPVPCPLVEQLPAGAFEPACAVGADLRTDIGAYRIWRDGVCVERCADVRALWHADLVAFLIGCSFSFERALTEAGLPPRHVLLGSNVPMYVTSIPLAPAGRFGGTWVVSMRPYRAADVERVHEVTRPFTDCHGEPVAWGDPAALGIRNLADPDEGDAVPLESGDVPVFWGCGVTPQRSLLRAGVPFAITHEPGHMFVTDRNEETSRR